MDLLALLYVILYISWSAVFVCLILTATRTATELRNHNKRKNEAYNTRRENDSI